MLLIIHKNNLENQYLENFVKKDEIKSLYPNIKLAKKLLDWEPQTSFKKGIEKTINDYKNKEIKLANKAIKKCLVYLKNLYQLKENNKEVKLNLDQQFHNIIINVLKNGLPVLSEENQKK